MQDILRALEKKIELGDLPEDLRPLVSQCASSTINYENVILLAKALFQTGFRSESVYLLENIVTDELCPIEAHYLFAGTLYSLSDYKRALANAEAALKRYNGKLGKIGAHLVILRDRAHANLGGELTNSEDPLFASYEANIARLRSLGPLEIAHAGESSEFLLEDWQKSILASFRCALGESGQNGKSAHWDRFRKDFERIIRTRDIWPNFRAYGLSHGLDDDLTMFDRLLEFIPANSDRNVDSATVAPFAIARLCERAHAVLEDLLEVLPEPVVAKLSEAKIGNPVTFTSPKLSVPFNYHDLGCTYYADRISQHVPSKDAPKILEIGGGYGAMAAKLKLLVPSAQITLVDLPESCALQQYYLQQRFPEARVLTAPAIEADPSTLDRQWDFILIANTKRNLIDALRFDMAVNVRSFMEMEVKTIREYTNWFRRSLLAEGVCYLANRIEKRIAGRLIRHEDYGIPEHWSLVSEAPFPIQPHIHEFIYSNR